MRKLITASRCTAAASSDRSLLHLKGSRNPDGCSGLNVFVNKLLLSQSFEFFFSFLFSYLSLVGFCRFESFRSRFSAVCHVSRSQTAAAQQASSRGRRDSALTPLN